MCLVTGRSYTPLVLPMCETASAELDYKSGNEKYDYLRLTNHRQPEIYTAGGRYQTSPKAKYDQLLLAGNLEQRTEGGGNRISVHPYIHKIAAERKLSPRIK